MKAKRTKKKQAATSPKRRAPIRRERYGAAQRLVALRALLATPHGMTIEQICERFECGRHTAMRSVAALEATGEAIQEERDGRRIIYRIDARPDAVAGKLSHAH